MLLGRGCCIDAAPPLPTGEGAAGGQGSRSSNASHQTGKHAVCDRENLDICRGQMKMRAAAGSAGLFKEAVTSQAAPRSSPPPDQQSSHLILQKDEVSAFQGPQPCFSIVLLNSATVGLETTDEAGKTALKAS